MQTIHPPEQRILPASHHTIKAKEAPVSPLGDRIAEWSGKHPRVVVGTGLVLGGLIGWLLKRKN